MMKRIWEQIPFSARGAWLVISVAKDEVWIRDVHGGDEAPSRLYRLAFKDHTTGEIEIEFTETELWIRSKKTEGYCKCTFDTKGYLHIYVHSAIVQWEAAGGSYDTLVPVSETCLEHHCYEKQRKISFGCRAGKMTHKQEWNVRGSQNAAVIMDGSREDTYIVLENYKTVPEHKSAVSYEAAQQEIAADFAAWKQKFSSKSVCPQDQESFELAVYLTWCNIVRAEGQLSADAMYMTKNVMYNIWSWDNCFGSIALCKVYPDIAYGQFKIFMDQQDESGCYPDYVNDMYASWNCVKPPIHAWAYQKMIEKNSLFAQTVYLEPIYESLCRMTRYWTNSRKAAGAVFPVYYHGNDSGWDNASVFRRGMPVESPDLAAFLIHQMDLLAGFAERLGKREEAADWKKEADQYQTRFLERFWHENRLRAVYLPDQTYIGETSLLPFMSLLMGNRMPESVRKTMVSDLEQQFEQAYGLATEAPDSSYYKKGGYWLGPVWAPVTYILIDALRAGGDKEFAQRLAGKFCQAASVGRMAENYDPMSGEGYDDPGFSWSACVFLTLLDEYTEMEDSV